VATQTPDHPETSSVSYLMGSVDPSLKLGQQMHETKHSPPSSVIISSRNYAQISSYLSKVRCLIKGKKMWLKQQC